MKRSDKIVATVTAVVLTISAIAIALVASKDSVPMKESGPTASSQISNSPSVSITTSISAANKEFETLKVKSSKILAQYLLLLPDDTVASRTKRIAAVVDVSKMRTRDFTVGTNSCADRDRLRFQLTQQARIDQSGITIEQVSTSPRVIYMMVPAVLNTYDLSGNIYGGSDDGETCAALHEVPMNAAFEWTKTSKGWELTRFGNPGRSP